MARNFFLKLVSRNPDARYTASQALSHPWITRKFESIIPLSFGERHHVFKKQHDFANVFFIS